jgi:hypothetical protein
MPPDPGEIAVGSEKPLEGKRRTDRIKAKAKKGTPRKMRIINELLALRIFGRGYG